MPSRNFHSKTISLIQIPFRCLPFLENFELATLPYTGPSLWTQTVNTQNIVSTWNILHAVRRVRRQESAWRRLGQARTADAVAATLALVREDDGADETVADRIIDLPNSEVEEDRLDGHLLRARAHRVPAHFVEHYPHLVHLPGTRIGRL